MLLPQENKVNKQGLALFFIMIVLDQVTKFIFLGKSIQNPGIIFGQLSSLDPIIRVIFFSTFFSLILFVGIFLKFYYLSSPRFKQLTWGLSLFLAGITGNAIDRIRLGWVIDFIPMPWGIEANFADIVLLAGFLVLLFYIFKQNKELFFEDSQRSFKLLEPEYQISFATKFSLISFFSVLAMSIFSFVFLKVYNPLFNFFLQKVFISFSMVLGMLVMMISFVFGLVLSQRKIGPIYALKRFVNDIKEGKEGSLKLREMDSYKELENISKDIHELSKK